MQNQLSGQTQNANCLNKVKSLFEELMNYSETIKEELQSNLSNGATKGELSLMIKETNALVRKFGAKMHQLQMDFDWGNAPQPEWFDHYVDQMYLWSESKNPLWLERGVFGSLALKPDANILELCCGDGFNAKHIYSIHAEKIIAVDFDAESIIHAEKFNKSGNIEYKRCDIRKDMPEGKFDNVMWDGAIEHFTPDEINQILCGIKSRLKDGGVLTGYTICEATNGGKSLSHHEYEFKSKEDLMRFLTPHFKNVKVMETIFPNRHNLYFFASDSALPFDGDWGSICQFRGSSTLR